MIDLLGNRMKEYEDVYRLKIPRRSYTIIRIDGKSFHSYTKGLKRPFDEGLITDMDATAAYLCKNIMCAKLAYVQSDEISLLLTDFDDINTQPWFDNNLQKMASIAASMATAEFNRLRLIRACSVSSVDNQGIPHKDISLDEINNMKIAMFDARVFQIPQKTEVINYFIWRQKDATRNSISSVAQTLYSPKELNGVSSNEKQELIFQKGINWNEYSYREKRGGVITKVSYVNGVASKIEKSLTDGTPKFYIGTGMDKYENIPDNAVIRNKWEGVETPIFTQDKEFLNKLIPDNI